MHYIDTLEQYLKLKLRVIYIIVFFSCYSQQNANSSHINQQCKMVVMASFDKLKFISSKKCSLFAILFIYFNCVVLHYITIIRTQFLRRLSFIVHWLKFSIVLLLRFHLSILNFNEITSAYAFVYVLCFSN